MGKRWAVQRFTYISTTYSAGYVDHEISESLLAEPAGDPTDYTRTKRRAEYLVAHSGLPWLVLRPSILIGDWVSGRYSGKRYGLYQQWMGLERLMGDRYHPEIHTVAPSQPLNLVHQGVFQSACAYVRRWLPDNSVCNLVSDNACAPSMRELWDMWLKVVRPHHVHYYPRFEDVDLGDAKRVGVRVERVVVNNMTRVAFLANRQIDMTISNLSQTRGREEQVDYAEPPYLWTAKIFYARTGRFTDISELGGLRVGVNQESNAYTAAQQEIARYSDQAPTMVSYQRNAQGLMALRQGKIDAYSQDSPIIAALAADDRTSFEAVGAGFSPGLYGIGVPPNDSQWRDAVSFAL